LLPIHFDEMVCRERKKEEEEEEKEGVKDKSE
jgi:hypothetical protein